MRVLINAITITEGGALVVLQRLLKALCEADQQITWYIAGGKNILYTLPSSDNIIHLPYVWARKTPFHLFYWYEMELPKLIHHFKIDICFSHTNFLPRRRLSCPSLLLMHNAGYFSDEFTKLYLQQYKKRTAAFLWKQRNKWAYQSIKQASRITVQTQALADKISRRLNVSSERIFTIPHGLGVLENISLLAKSFSVQPVWQIGYVTKFGVQKDFYTAIKAISLLKKAGIQVKLVLTLSENIPEYPSILRIIQQYDVADNIDNKGDITSPEAIKKIYESLHLFIFPSIIESFGFTLVEAMAMGLPIVAADTESNREVTGSAASLFPVGDAGGLANKILEITRDADLYNLSARKSLARAHDFNWGKTAKAILQVMQGMQSNA